MSVNKGLIERIRTNILSTAGENIDRFHPKDVERVKTDDWAIERFVLVHHSEERALKALVKAMEWRKSYGVNDFTEDYFPEEIYKIGVASVYCKDKEGRPVVWYRLKRQLNKSQEFILLLRQYFVYLFEKVDECTRNQGWAVIQDTTGGGLSNVDLDTFKFNTEVLQNYYPRGMKYHAVIDMAWILNASAKVILAFMKEELRNEVKFHKKEELTQYLETQFIPVHLNGTYEEVFAIPPGVKPLKQLTHIKLSEEQIDKIHTIYKEWLN